MKFNLSILATLLAITSINASANPIDLNLEEIRIGMTVKGIAKTVPDCLSYKNYMWGGFCNVKSGPLKGVLLTFKLEPTLKKFGNSKLKSIIGTVDGSYADVLLNKLGKPTESASKYQGMNKPAYTWSASGSSIPPIVAPAVTSKMEDDFISMYPTFSQAGENAYSIRMEHDTRVNW